MIREYEFRQLPGRGGVGGGRSVRYGAVYCDVTRAVPTALFSHSEPIFVDVRTGRKVLAPRVSSADGASTERIPTGAVNTNLSLLLPSFFFSYRAYGHRALESAGANE